MAYVKNIWVDQDVERPRTYDVTTNQDGSITLADSFGVVTELGTPVNALNMNHIEEGIKDNSDNIGDLAELDTTSKSNLVEAINEIVLPSQTGNAGKFLKTDGSVVSWNLPPSITPDYSAGVSAISVSASSGVGYTPPSEGILLLNFSSGSTNAGAAGYSYLYIYNSGGTLIQENQIEGANTYGMTNLTLLVSPDYSYRIKQSRSGGNYTFYPYKGV